MQDGVDVLFNIISSLGFPIAIAVYALYNASKHDKFLQDTLQTSLKDNTEAINKLSELIDKLLMSKSK